MALFRMHPCAARPIDVLTSPGDAGIVVPPLIVDLLPERLWWPGNIYRVFGRDLHLCVAAGGHRTVELEGREIGRGTRGLAESPHGHQDEVRDRLLDVDLGWLSAALVVGLLLLVWVASRRSA
jgi:hypothetical protein